MIINSKVQGLQNQLSGDVLWMSSKVMGQTLGNRLLLLLLPTSQLCLFRHSPSCHSLVVDPASHSFPTCKNSARLTLPPLHTFSFTFSLGPSFLFLSQRLQQESHGRPLQADALQLVLHFVLEVSEPDGRVDQNHCQGWKEIGRSSQSNLWMSQSQFSRATQK